MAYSKETRPVQVGEVREGTTEKIPNGTTLLARLGGILTTTRRGDRDEAQEAFFPEWSTPESDPSVAAGSPSKGWEGALKRAPSVSDERSFEPLLREAFARSEWAELEDLLWEVHAKAQLGGKKELALRAQALAEWVARAANTVEPTGAPSELNRGAGVPWQGESLLEEVILRLNHLCWIEDSVREGFVGA